MLDFSLSLSTNRVFYRRVFNIHPHTHTRYKDTNSLEQPPKLNILLNVLQRKSTIKNIKKARIQTTKPIILTKTKNFVEQKQRKNKTKGKRLALSWSTNFSVEINYFVIDSFTLWVFNFTVRGNAKFSFSEICKINHNFVHSFHLTW